MMICSRSICDWSLSLLGCTRLLGRVSLAHSRSLSTSSVMEEPVSFPNMGSRVRLLKGTSIDQGIAYVLMLVALVLTYLINPLDASSSYNFF
ncbi:hypothetical protein IFM89_029826 [Coptis chinensis]|uniref:Uncharacterized protein n=1 Tax=Coptis chinensis TaxID=261450 RepID=A0A835LRT7_9MAGN|nr:hypothetical protein IFM89_029826 [Coptis chinensis]